MNEIKTNLYHWAELDDGQRRTLCRRAEAEVPEEVADRVQEILEAVRREGDLAVIRYTYEFDRADLKGKPLSVSEEEIRSSGKRLAEDLKASISFAVQNVRRVHEKQRPRCLELCEVRPGVFAGERQAPLPSAGLYVPRGRGSFPSVMYMQAVPADIAGVKRVACITPPDRQGAVDAATLFTAGLCGVTEVYRVGGIQGIAALAYGTESIPAVDKILGPGSIYVAAAKKALADQVDVGLPAGPSEAIVLADGTADPLRLALDLVTEAEHGADSSAFLVTSEPSIAEAVRNELPKLLGKLSPLRAGFVESVLGGFGGIVVTESMDQAVDFVNMYAPEHLQIACTEPFTLLDKIKNAGEILLGQHSAFSLANYAVGCNNVIPTGGWAKTRSPLSVKDFLKSSSVVYVAEQGIEGLGVPVTTLADYEGFDAHALAIRRRLKSSR